VKILFILEYYYPHIGGVETLFHQLVNSLPKSYEITIITCRHDQTLLRFEEYENIKIIRLPSQNRYLFTFFAFFPALLYARKKDLIHCTSYNAGLPAFLAAKLLRKKIIITFHEYWGKLWFNLPGMSTSGKVLHFLFEWFLIKCSFTRFIAVSENTCQRLISAGIPSMKVSTIYNGIDYQKFSPFLQKEPKKNQVFHFLYFGRIGISKGINLLLEAIKILHSTSVQFHLTTVVPTQPQKPLEQLKRTINQSGLTSFVSFRHQLSDDELYQTIRNADAVVIPSYSEGFCFSAVESMALQTPVIASKRGALPEVISGKHLFFDPFTSEALAGAMHRAVEGKWDFSPQKEYPLQNTIDSYMKLYDILEK